VLSESETIQYVINLIDRQALEPPADSGRTPSEGVCLSIKTSDSMEVKISASSIHAYNRLVHRAYYRVSFCRQTLIKGHGSAKQNVSCYRPHANLSACVSTNPRNKDRLLNRAQGLVVQAAVENIVIAVDSTSQVSLQTLDASQLP
jgi:hypothetical protein